MVWNRFYTLWQPLTDSTTSSSTTNKRSTTTSSTTNYPSRNILTLSSSTTNHTTPSTIVHSSNSKPTASPIYSTTTSTTTTTTYADHNTTTALDPVGIVKLSNAAASSNTTTFNDNSTTKTNYDPSLLPHLHPHQPLLLLADHSEVCGTNTQQHHNHNHCLPAITKTSSDSLSRVYPTRGSQPPTQVAYSSTSEIIMSRKSSSRRMGWKQKGSFKPLPQEDNEDDDWDTDQNNQTEEDILLDHSDEEGFELGPVAGFQRSGDSGVSNIDFRYGSGGGFEDCSSRGDEYGYQESVFGDEGREGCVQSQIKLLEARKAAGKAATAGILSSSKAGLSGKAGIFGKAAGASSKTGIITGSGNRNDPGRESVGSATREGSSSTSGSGGSVVSCYGDVMGKERKMMAAGGESSAATTEKRGRVIATPWGAAWIGKRKKGVTYVTPSQSKGSVRSKNGRGRSGEGEGRENDCFVQHGHEDRGIAAVAGREKTNSDSGSGSVESNDSSMFLDLGEMDSQQRGQGHRKYSDDVILGYDDDDDDDDWDLDHLCDPSCPLLARDDVMGTQSPALSAFSGQRRSSFTSSTSSKDSFSSHHASSRKPRRHLASLSIDDVTGGGAHGGGEYGGISGPLRSPGILSTASMWSTSDLHHNMAKDTDRSGGTNSLSNVSGSFNERMHNLVRAFSERTARTKENISQPPTPSSDSDVDAKSGTSAVNEPPGNRNIRLGSFLPLESRASEASDGNVDHFVGVWHCKFKMPRVLKKFRFPSTIEPHSKTYVSWLFIVTMAFMYNACVIPLRGVFPYQTPANVKYWLIADYVCDFIYLVDIFVFKVRLRFTNQGIVELDRKETTKHYMKKWMFRFDLLSLTPLDLLYFIDGVGVNPWLRLCRLFKIQAFWEFYEKCDQSSRSSAPAIRIIKTMTYMLFLIHIETCGYYAVSKYEGIGSNQWVYNGQGIAYIRCFYLATKTATSIGNNPKPINELEYGFMTLYWLSGVFVFALLIGQIRDIVEAAGLVKDSYRKKMDACLWYMQSINMPQEMKDRVREWFLYNWDQQKTIDEQSLVSTLPKKLQTDLAINVHFQTLSKVQLFQDCEKNLLFDLVLKLKPILFLPGDYICKKGEVGKEMYIVTQGQVEVVGGENNETVLATLHEGSVFGEISLLAMSGRGNRRTADVRSKGYTNVFTLSKFDFEEAMTEYPEAQSLLKKRAKKLLKANAKMEKKSKVVEAEEIIKTPAETPKLLKTVIQVMDPDSNLVKQLGSIIKSGASNRKRRPVSRSHSHRLSPSQSGLQHLTPPRSHSYRHTRKSPSNSSLKGLTAALAKSPRPDEKTGLDSDDQEEPVFQESSDELSLSEVFQDAGTTSSFEDDDDDDDGGDADNEDNNIDDEDEELLIIEQYEDDENENEGEGLEEKGGGRGSGEREMKMCWGDKTLVPPDEKESSAQLNARTLNGARKDGGGTQPKTEVEKEKEEAGAESKRREQVEMVEREREKERLEPARICVEEEKRTLGSDKEDGRSERSKGESTIPSEDSQDSGLPDVQRSDSRSSSGKKEAGREESRNGSKCNSRNSGRGSRCSMGSNAEQPGTSSGKPEEMTIVMKSSHSHGALSKRQLEIGDSMEDYIERQIFPPGKEVKELAAVNMKKSVSAHLIVCSEKPGETQYQQDTSSSSSTLSGAYTHRVRKLSVVSPPHSPKADFVAQQKDKEGGNGGGGAGSGGGGHMWGSNSNLRTQVFSWKDTASATSPNSLKPFTPVETIQIRALPPIDSKSKSPSIKSPKSVVSSPEVVYHSSGSSSASANVPSLANGLEGCCGGGPLVDIPPENRVVCSVEIHRPKSSSSTTTTDIHGHIETSL